MGGNGPRRYTGDLVNIDAGRISRDIFTDQAIYFDLKWSPDNQKLAALTINRIKIVQILR